MRKIKKTSGFYKYLMEENLFGQGDDVIAEARKRYRREYLKQKKQEYRQKHVEHTISLKPIDEKNLNNAAQEHGMNTVEYIRHASLAYTNKKYLTPRIEAIQRVYQSIMYLRTQVARIQQEKKGIFSRNKEEQIEELLTGMERTMQAAFQEPLDLEALLLETVKNDPLYGDRLRKMLS
jgi:hypothetical protein